ncbi:MAG: phosphate acyltransferase PlsX [Oscillospiraceae bacterium]|nr:phosphate acyltransferase PlsX [Oscillospiraceae bacterium]
MRIVIDGFGGDNAPDEVIRGAVAASREYNVEVIITGDEKVLESRVKALQSETGVGNLSIVNADGVIQVEDNPLEIRKSKKNSSMGVAFDLVKTEKADAIVSAGSTAALMVGGSMVIGRIKGIKRPALSPIMPSINGKYILADGGANLECRPEVLLQFGIMGSIYINKVMGVEKPRVGLLNIGTEEEKGRELEQQAYALFKSTSQMPNAKLNFVGNVEAREVPLGGCDVIVTDGFTGNIYLKTVEGMGGFMKSTLKQLFGKNALTKAGYLFAKSGVADFTKKTDYRETGGSPLLGTAKPVIKAHGSSDAKAFKNAIRQAKEFVESNAIKEIERQLV